MRVALALLASALLLAACGGGSTGATPEATAAGSGATPASTDAAGGDGATVGDTAAAGTDTLGVEVTGELGAKPVVTLPGGEPPADLVIVDLIAGAGEEATAGATVTTDYLGVSWLNGGTEFDNSYDSGQPISFPLDGVIAGWQEGIPGMQVGGRRLLIIPPELAYGENSPTPAIAPNDTWCSSSTWSGWADRPPGRCPAR